MNTQVPVQPGLPDPNVEPDITPLSKRAIFDYLPPLDADTPGDKPGLLKHGGLPGVTYAQVSVFNRRRAQDEGWHETYSDGEPLYIYTIRSEKGSIDMHLLSRGTPIFGASPDAGARRCWVDGLVTEHTGYPIPLESGELFIWNPETEQCEYEPAPEPKKKRGPGRPPKKEAA